MACPCCSQAVAAAPIEVITARRNLTSLQAEILRAVWNGKGMPVPTERIFDAMYADDPDGGPEAARMYATFKVSLVHLRARLEGSGVAVESVGNRRGYRLVIKGI